MTENLPAVRTEIVNAELVQPSTDSWTAVIEDVALLAQRIAGTQFVPRGLRDSVPATAAAILYGREVGLPPMTALAGVHVVDGRPTMSAELLRGMVLAAGHEIVYDETSGATCTVRGKRSGSEHWTKVTWTLDMARAAGLLGKDNWKKYPRAMLVARATAELCRMAFPDVTHGMRATEELDDAAAAVEAGGAPQLEAGTTKVQRRPRRGSAHPQTGGEAATQPAVSPVAAGTSPVASSPPTPPLPGEPGYDAPEGGASLPTSPGTASGGPDDTAVLADPAVSSSVGADGEVLEGPGESTGASTKGEPAPAGPSAPTTQTPAPASSVAEGPAEGASPLAREQVREGDAPLGGQGASPDPEEIPVRPPLRSTAQAGTLMGQFRRLNVSDRQERLDIILALIGRDVASTKELRADEATTLIDALAMCRDRAMLDGLVRAATAGESGG